MRWGASDCIEVAEISAALMPLSTLGPAGRSAFCTIGAINHEQMPLGV